MNFDNSHFEAQSADEKSYKKFLSVKRVEAQLEKHSNLRFAVTENFTIFITNQGHSYLSENYGVDLDKTLAEGYIFFDKEGKITTIDFKPNYQATPAFEGTAQELAQLHSDVAEKIRESLEKKQPSTRDS